MKIKIDDLQEVLIAMLLRFKDRNGEEVELKNDYYWELSSKEMYDPCKEPVDFSIGQLTDDWETIKKNIKSDTLIPYDLERLSRILKVLSLENSIF